jgi:hypothetical protein
MQLREKISIDDLHDLVSQTTTTTTTTASITSASTILTTFAYHPIKQCSFWDCSRVLIVVIVFVSVSFCILWFNCSCRKKPRHNKSTNVNWVGHYFNFKCLSLRFSIILLFFIKSQNASLRNESKSFLSFTPTVTSDQSRRTVPSLSFSLNSFPNNLPHSSTYNF